MKIERLIWLSKDGQREPVTLDRHSGKIAVRAFEVSPDELGVRPRFEPDGDQTVNAWALVAPQPWMTAGSGPHGGYFAPRALQPLNPAEAAHGAPA